MGAFRENFISCDGDLETEMMRVAPNDKKRDTDFVSNLDATVHSMKQLPWMALEDMKGDPDLLKKIEDAEALSRSLRQNLSKEK